MIGVWSGISCVTKSSSSKNAATPVLICWLICLHLACTCLCYLAQHADTVQSNHGCVCYANIISIFVASACSDFEWFSNLNHSKKFGWISVRARAGRPCGHLQKQSNWMYTKSSFGCKCSLCGHCLSGVVGVHVFTKEANAMVHFIEVGISVHLKLFNIIKSRMGNIHIFTRR